MSIHFKDQSILRCQILDKRVTHAAKVVVHAFKSSTQEAEVMWSLRPVWSPVYNDFQGGYTNLSSTTTTTKKTTLLNAVNFGLGTIECL